MNYDSLLLDWFYCLTHDVSGRMAWHE